MNQPDQAASAESKALAGMQLALEHAEAEQPAWGEIAYRYLLRFAERNYEFQSEDVSDAANVDESFPKPPTDRAWGSVYRRASKAGVIRQCGTAKSRRRHASICPRWVSLINRAS